MQRLDSIQIMRGIAALMVLIGHAIAEAEHYLSLTLTGGMIPWTRGVDLFFVISGVIIALSGRRYAGQPGGARAFLVRRVIRVVPLYYIFTTLMLIVLLLAPGGLKETTFDAGQILSSYAFYPYARADGRIAPILSLGWTLNYEIFFYLVFSLCLTLQPPRGLFALAGIMVALALLGLVLDPVSPAFDFWTNTILLEFLFGVILAEIWLKTRGALSESLGLGALILGAGFVLLVMFHGATSALPRAFQAGLPAVVMVAGPLYLWGPETGARLPRWGVLLGDSSYALYLSHRFVLRGVTLVLVPTLPATALGGWLYVTLVASLAIITGILVFRWIETPLLTTLNRRFLTPRPVAGPA